MPSHAQEARAASPYPRRFRRAPERSLRIGRVLRRVAGVHDVDEGLLDLIGRRMYARDEPGAELARAMRGSGGPGTGRVTMAQFRTALDEGVAAVPDAPPELVRFFARVDDLPPWVDFDLVERGAGVVRRLGRTMTDVLLQLSLIGGYRFGLRYQLSALNAAIGLAQLDHFDKTAARRHLWHSYRTALTPMSDVTLIDVDPDHAVPHLCQIRIPRRDEVFAYLRKAHIGVGVHYPPNHLQPAFATWHRPLPVTEQTGKQILSLPFHQHLTEADIAHVVRALRTALDATDTAPHAGLRT